MKVSFCIVPTSSVVRPGGLLGRVGTEVHFEFAETANTMPMRVPQKIALGVL
jgi:hypothetical protein